MFKPAAMRKVRIIVLSKVVEQLIKSLHEQGFLEIRRTMFAGLVPGRPLDFYNEVSEQLIKIRGIAAVLQKHLAKYPDVGNNIIDGRDAVAQAKSLDISARLKALSDEAVRLESEISILDEQSSTALKLLCFKGINFANLKSGSINYYVGEVKPNRLHTLKKAIDAATEQYELLCPGYDTTGQGKVGSCIVLLLIRHNNDIEAVLAEHEFKHIQLPVGLTVPAATLERLKVELKGRQNRLYEVRSELSQLAAEHYPKIRILSNSLEVAADRAEISSRFGFSKSVYVIEGWIEAENHGRLKRTVLNFGEAAMVADAAFSHHEMPPTVLDNPTPAGPFEFLTQNYSLPNYYEIDPTMIYMLTVPLLLGMIVGDVVYGIMMILVSLWLMKVFKKSYIMSNVSKLWYYSGFATILFGMVFDEWFGFHHVQLFKLLDKWGLTMPSGSVYTGLSRIHDLSLLIGITVLVGLVHLGIGFVIGAMNEWKHSKKHAMAKFAWLGVEIGGTVAVASIVLHVPGVPEGFGIWAGALLAVSAIVLAITEGFIGILEIPGLMGNALSYARIAAIGVVGVVLAEIINDYFTPEPSAGLLLIIFIPLFFALHFVNMFVAMFEALIQGGRLNLIEFRSKFLKGGGRIFAPFSMKGFSEDSR